MHFFNKLYWLLRIYPWRGFVTALSIIALVFVVIGLVNRQRSNRWLKKLSLTFSAGLSGLLLLLSGIVVVFCAFFFFTWITNVSWFNNIENYLVNVVLLLLISLLFGTFAFFIQLSAQSSYKLDNINQGDFFRPNDMRYAQKIETAQREHLTYTEVLKKMDSEISLTFLGYAKNVNPEKLRNDIQNNNLASKGHLKIFKIDGLSIHYAYQPIQPTHHGGTPPANYFLTEQDFFHLENRSLSTYPDIYFDFSAAVAERLSNGKGFQKVRRILYMAIAHLEETVIPAINEFYNGTHVKPKVFLYAYIVQALNFNQNYVVPLSNLAKFNHLLFALFRLLMQGAFIGLVIKDVLKT